MDCILGIDFLSQARAKLSLGERSVQLFGDYFTCEKHYTHQHSTAAINTTGYPAVDKVLADFQDVFSTDQAKLGKCYVETCKINTGDAMPIKQRPR